MTHEEKQSQTITFGKQLKQWRERAGLSQEQLAERAGLTAKGISALERGERRHPYPQTVQALAEALNLSGEQQAAWLALLPQRGTAVSEKPVTPSQLPIPFHKLIGREVEITAVLHFLEMENVRLLTLTGPGGVGKTRLAIQIARLVESRFRDGVTFVALASLDDPALVLSAMTHTVGLYEMGRQPDYKTLHHYLRDKQMMMVLDNFEHVLAAASEIALLLAACPGITLLVTSRAPLRIQGEQEYPVAPLALPSAVDVLPMEEVQTSPAIQLFVQRAQAVAPHFEITPTNATAVAAICHRLDGLPLALELAAARIKLLTPAVLLARLDQTLPLLVGGARDLPERQQTMRQTIAWSYNLLTEAEQQLFRRLGVFAGTWSLEAAEFICQGSFPANELLDGVASLLDKSLVYGVEGNGRFALLKTIRAYALEHLMIAGEQDDIQHRLLNWYLQLAQEAEEQMTGPAQAAWLRLLEEEHPNLRIALEWAFTEHQTTSEHVAGGLQIVCALYRFWQGRGYLTEGRAWLERGLSHRSPISPTTRAQALNVLGWLMHQQGDIVQAIELQQESVALYRELGDERGVAGSLDSLGDAAWIQGDLATACSAYEESLKLRRTMGDAHDIALSLYSLGRLQLDYGHEREAESHLVEAQTLLTQLADHRGIALALHALGRLAFKQGHLLAATKQMQKALMIFCELGNKVDMAECLELLAMVAQTRGEVIAAVHLWAAAANLRMTIGVPMRVYDEAALMPLRLLLTEAAFETAWREGSSQPLEATIAWAVTL